MLTGAIEIEFSEAQLREIVGRYLQIHGGTVFGECRVTTVQRVDFELMAGSTMTKGYRFVVILDPPEEQPVPDVPVPGTWNRIVGPGEEPRR